MKFFTAIRNVILITILLSLAACTGSADNVNKLFDTDEVKYTSTPANQQTSVPTNLQRISISFDRDIDIDSINEQNLTIYPAITGIIDKTDLTSQNTVYLLLQETLTANTNYVASISGVTDAEGNELDTYAWSFSTEIDSQDASAPSMPSNLRTAISGPTNSSVQLLWNPSTDNIGVAGYRVMRGNTVISTTVNTTFTDINLAPGTAYQYSIVAFDAANNTAASNALSITTLAAIDTSDPTAPNNLRASTGSITSSSVQLIWNSSTDNLGIAGYRVMRGNTVISTTMNTTFTDMALAPGTAYQYSIVAFDAANNTAASNALSITTLAAIDTTDPTAPNNLRASTGSISSSSVQLIWDSSTDNIGVAGYRVMRGNTVITTTMNTAFTDMALAPGTTYQYSIVAFDAANNTAVSNLLSVETLAAVDTTDPTAPNNLRTGTDSITSSSVQLIWDPSTDNIAVAGYRVMRGNAVITTTTNTTFTDMSLAPGTAYQYSIVAFDAANNTAGSSALSITTLNVTTGVATLSWTPPTANTDESSLTDLSGYKIYYGLSPDALTNSITVNNAGITSYVVENLTTNVVYYFSITAINGLNIESDLSNVTSKLIL